MTDSVEPIAGEVVAALTRPIIGMENRSALEVFDIMSDRVTRALSQPKGGDAEAVALDDPMKVLRLIAEGYPATGEGDRYVVVENPDFQEDNGSSPNLVVDTFAHPPQPKAPELDRAVARLRSRLTQFAENPGGHWVWKPSDIEAATAILSSIAPDREGDALTQGDAG